MFAKLTALIKKRWMYVLGWLVAFLPLSFLVGVRGRGNIPRQKNVVVISNHEAFMDPYLITALFPLRYHLRWIAKSSLRSVRELHRDAEEIDKKLRKKPNFIVRFLRRAAHAFSVFFAKSTGTIMIRPGVSTVETCVEILRQGVDAVGVFPTGTRRYVDPQARAHKGFVVIARTAGVPVVPVKIRRVGRLRWRMEILPSIPTEKLADDSFGADDEERARKIMALIDKVSFR